MEARPEVGGVMWRSLEEEVAGEVRVEEVREVGEGREVDLGGWG